MDSDCSQVSDSCGPRLKRRYGIGITWGYDTSYLLGTNMVSLSLESVLARRDHPSVIGRQTALLFELDDGEGQRAERNSNNCYHLEKPCTDFILRIRPRHHKRRMKSRLKEQHPTLCP